MMQIFVRGIFPGVCRVANCKMEKHPPVYTFEAVNFFTEERLAQLLFFEEKMYRIVGYKMMQNQAEPVYGPWIKQGKTLKRTIMLTDDVLEALPQNPDALIRNAAFEILEADINIPRPSWFLQKQQDALDVERLKKE